MPAPVPTLVHTPSRAAAALVAGALLFATGCENKCDELVTVLADCVSGDVGAGETNETVDDPSGDTECSSADSTCSTCILESKLDLCVDYGAALAQCRESGDCE
ncbi:MAG: hypothetical protein IPM79_30130 [Polyangiaceae bacterium]|jgi:hypothetical protein|nr:hypothetical protein [Polyangiaceae bacterium]MBK8941744.1 hypothetical protein [Polyangiaceae bacterium]